jgi:GMP synthase (glutamine-hydrolysing)
MPASPRYLLLQVRNSGDPMRQQEITCFAAAIGCDVTRITPVDLLSGTPSQLELDQHDVVLFGGSGHYSATTTAPWLDKVLALMQQLHADAKPTFASCWGFQAMARALGGVVIHDMEHAELGTHKVHLTDAGRRDPVFGPLGDTFEAHMGHEDRVLKIPPGAQLLASTSLVENQAYGFPGLPIYATQFHPELTVANMMQRVCTYPEYATRIAGVPPERFGELCRDTPAASTLLPRFVRHVFGEV